MPPTLEDGRWAAAETAAGNASAALISRLAAWSDSPRNSTVVSVRGRGSTRMVIVMSTASVPQDPAISLGKSNPVTFLTTAPPPLSASPRPETAVKPRM